MRCKVVNIEDWARNTRFQEVKSFLNDEIRELPEEMASEGLRYGAVEVLPDEAPKEKSKKFLFF